MKGPRTYQLVLGAWGSLPASPGGTLMFDDIDPFNLNGNQKSELQRDILRVYDRNPNMDPKHIADKLDCSASYVRETIKEYRSIGGGFW